MSKVPLSVIVAKIALLAHGTVTGTSVREAEEALRLAGLHDLPDVDEFLDVCASFRPGGGDYLYDEAAMQHAAQLLIFGSSGMEEPCIPLPLSPTA